VKIWRTISGKVEDAISFKAKWYRFWTWFPLFSWLWMVFQCHRYSILVSLSTGNILGSTDELLEDWGLWIRGLFVGLLDGPGSGNVKNSVRRREISLNTCKQTSNLLKPIPATSAEGNSTVPILRNAMRNPTTTQLPVPFVVNFLIERKTCSVTDLCTKDLKWCQGC
jgi:hypothetical protein